MNLVLIAEDDASQRRMLRRVLFASAYLTEEIASVAEWAEVQHRRFQVALVDLCLPTIDAGQLLIAQIATAQPDCRIAVITGWPELPALPKVDVVIRKPYNLVDLLDQVGLLCDMRAADARERGGV